MFCLRQQTSDADGGSDPQGDEFAGTGEAVGSIHCTHTGPDADRTWMYNIQSEWQLEYPTFSSRSETHIQMVSLTNVYYVSETALGYLDLVITSAT